MPHRGKHENHPGHSEKDCPLRMKIDAAHNGTSHNGYACSWTGGHCRKSDACDSRVQQHNQEQN